MYPVVFPLVAAFILGIMIRLVDLDQSTLSSRFELILLVVMVWVGWQFASTLELRL